MKIIKKLLTNSTSLLGLTLLFIFVLIALFAPLLAPPEENARNVYMIPHDGFSPTPKPPSAEHPFGTTEWQYDIYYGVIWGTRTAFRIGVSITLFTTLIGLAVGSISAYYGGWLDEVLMRIVEIFQAFPFLLAAITLTSVLQTVYGRPSAIPILFFAKILAFFTFGTNPAEQIGPIQLQILTAMVSIIAFGWMTYARVIRGNILALKEQEYIQAARVIGVRNHKILLRHMLPNAVFPVLVIASLDIGSQVLNFAALSFLGLGAQYGYADWGQMINFARNWIPALSTYWWILVFPGTAIILFVLAWNLVGDAIRDILDPRLTGSRA